jgi:hypothetical protein
VGQGIAAALFALLLVRFGALSMIVGFWAFFLTNLVPVTFDWSASYGESSWLIVGTILALAVYGFRAAVARRPIGFGRFEPQAWPGSGVSTVP